MAYCGLVRRRHVCPAGAFQPGPEGGQDADYNFLHRIQRAEGEPSKQDRNREKALETGKRLLEVKAALPRGEFLAWVEREACLSYGTVQRYMRLAREVGAEPLSLTNSGELTEY